MINSRTIQYPFEESDLTRLIEYDGSNLALYQGRAPPGTPTSAAASQIRKFLYDGSKNETARKFAGGTNDYNQVWGDRATLSYS
ncbi:MAG: hypothetical protein K9N21_17380 [Deltaproteobacteria bacterium]|nr:hypothetical protein [Deltaproteobacteria bacterium]